MNIVVPIKLVPDLVEELSIDPGGTALDTTWLRMILNELDDHAIEQAILLKEQVGGSVTIIAPGIEGADDILFTASAKGADRLVKFVGDFTNEGNNHTLASAYTTLIPEFQPDLVLTGVQAHNDLDGSIGPLIASYLGMPYVGYVSGVTVDGKTATVRKEYPGGVIAEITVALPAVLGIQAAAQPPRYVAVSKIRQAMKTTSIDEREMPLIDLTGGASVRSMFQPETGARATMLEGDPTEIATRLVGIFKELGVL